MGVLFPFMGACGPTRTAGLGGRGQKLLWLASCRCVGAPSADKGGAGCGRRRGGVVRGARWFMVVC
jgi:hypothetical protein